MFHTKTITSLKRKYNKFDVRILEIASRFAINSDM
jgi:hypothetical protein